MSAGRRDDPKTVIILAVALFTLGGLLALYGVFAIAYRGDGAGSGSTYVTIVGHELDATPIGLVAVVLGAAAVLLAAVLVRRRVSSKREVR